MRDRVREVRRALLDVLGPSRVARPGKLVGVPQLVDDLRKALHEVAQRTDERHEQEDGEDCDDDCRAEHDDCRRNAASPSRPPDEGAQRDLEDESEEDPEEDEDQRVADRDNGLVRGGITRLELAAATPLAHIPTDGY